MGSPQWPNMMGPKGANTEGPKGATTEGPSVAGCAFLLWATGGCLHWAPCGRHIGSLVGQCGMAISRSCMAMSPFDKAHTTSYSTLIETVHPSCTVFEIEPVRPICRKSPILAHITCILAPSQRRDFWHQKTRFLVVLFL